MKADAVLRLRFVSKKHLEVVFQAMEPEVRKTATTRSKTTLGRDGTFLVLKIKAKDTVALRAALNAYLRWINSILGILEILRI